MTTPTSPKELAAELWKVRDILDAKGAWSHGRKVADAATFLDTLPSPSPAVEAGAQRHLTQDEREKINAAMIAGTEFRYDADPETPASHVLVPRETTEEMINAGSMWWESCLHNFKPGKENAEIIYNAMLAAAPAPSLGAMARKPNDAIQNLKWGGHMPSDDERKSLCDYIAALESNSPSRSSVIEEAAKVADSHIGSAAEKRRNRGVKLNENIQDEERGEDIAARVIAAAIRSLADKSDEGSK